MELATFGAVLRWALDLEGRAISFYEQTDLAVEADAARERLRHLERARREMISEMLLESIPGLESSRYQVELDPTAGTQMEQARHMEETLARFYSDAGARMPLREVARLFARLAVEHEQARDRL